MHMTQSRLSTWLPTLQHMVWERFFRTPFQIDQSGRLHLLYFPSLQTGEIVNIWEGGSCPNSRSEKVL